jgi:hypothetical protein
VCPVVLTTAAQAGTTRVVLARPHGRDELGDIESLHLEAPLEHVSYDRGRASSSPRTR